VAGGRGLWQEFQLLLPVLTKLVAEQNGRQPLAGSPKTTRWRHGTGWAGCLPRTPDGGARLPVIVPAVGLGVCPRMQLMSQSAEHHAQDRTRPFSGSAPFRLETEWSAEIISGHDRYEKR